jgi:hypothetical protein
MMSRAAPEVYIRLKKKKKKMNEWNKNIEACSSPECEVGEYDCVVCVW